MDRIRIGVVALDGYRRLCISHTPQASGSPARSGLRQGPLKGEAVAEKFGLERVYSDVNQMLETEDLHAVVVCTSTDAHREVAVACMRAGRTCSSRSRSRERTTEAAEMATVARETKRKLMVG